MTIDYPEDVTWSIRRYVDDQRDWATPVLVYANDYECAREDPVSGWTTYVDGPSPARGFFAWRKRVRILGIEDFFGDGIYSDGGYKVTGPDGAVIELREARISNVRICQTKTPCWTTVIDFTL